MKSQTQQSWFRILFAVSFLLAFWGWSAPRWLMGLDYHAMLWRSIPLACLWALTVALSVRWFGRKALWMLLGGLLALYWPVWLALNGIPQCYWLGTCE
jgi:hypothetical protein